MEVMAFDEDFDHFKKNFIVEHLLQNSFFAEYLLLEHLSMAASIELKII